MAYPEEKDPRTGKAPRHQAAAEKAFQDISNAEVKAKTDGCAEKIMEKLDDWNPNEESVEKLADLLNELDNCDDYNVDDPYALESRLSVADEYKEFADDYAHFPLWTVDYEGYALVGEDAGTIKPVDEIDEDYFTLHGFSREEIVAIEKIVDAKMMEDEPDDDARGKIYHFEDGSEWSIFENSDLAESRAVEYVRGMLENEPEMFNRDWLQKHVAVGDTDKRMLAIDKSKNYAYDQIDDDSAMKEAGLDDKFDELQEEIEVLESEIEDLEEEKANLESEKEDEEVEKEEDEDKINKLSNEIDDLESEISSKMDEIHVKGKEQEALPDEAREKVEENKYDEIYEELEDPVQYFVEDHGLYNIEDLMKASFITIDVEDAAYDAIDEDGAAHFLASYDGNEVEVGNGMVMFRTE